MPGIKKLVKKVKRAGTKARAPARKISKAAIGAGKVATALGARGAGRKITKAGRVGAKVAIDKMRSSTGR